MKPIKISLAHARALAISSQRLDVQQNRCTRSEVLELLEHLGYVQIDTLSVVERAHHHVLWSRLPSYRINLLNELLQKRLIFEYWGHAASYLPMKDYRYSLIRKREYRLGRSHWFEQDKQVKRKVLERIKREGPLLSKDFETPESNKASWYFWKPAKRALEQLFMEGRLMVSYRHGFQKVYDLAENVIPPGTDTSMPTRSAYAIHLVKTAVATQGIVTQREMYYQRGAWEEEINRAIRKLRKDGAIAEYHLEGHEQLKCYGPAEWKEPEETDQYKQQVHILSPFDNLLIQRNRLRRLFGFDYTIECYLPAHKRMYGYFTLPILYGNRFIARLDPKADRQKKKLYIRNLVMEDLVTATEEMLEAIAARMAQFAGFNNCHTIVLEQCNQKKTGQQLRKLLKRQLQQLKESEQPTR